MKRLISISLFTLITFSSCYQGVRTLPSKQIPTEGAHLDCECYQGISSSAGDRPVSNITFSNGIILTICGYMEEHVWGESAMVSEFNVFDCRNGNVLAEYGALQLCNVYSTPDTLFIDETKSLPIGEDWNWEAVQISRQLFTVKNKRVVSPGAFPSLGKFGIDPRLQEVFLSELEAKNNSTDDWENDLGKLEALSILGNSRAWNILKNYDSFIGTAPDGAMAEQWKSAIATVEYLGNSN